MTSYKLSLTVRRAAVLGAGCDMSAAGSLLQHCSLHAEDGTHGPHPPPAPRRTAYRTSNQPPTTTIYTRTGNDESVKLYICTITEKDPTRAFSWLKADTTAFTFKTLNRQVGPA